MGVQTHIRRKNFSAQAERTHIEKPYVSLMYEWFHFWNEIPWSPTFLLFRKKNGKSAKEENAAPSLRPEKLSGHYPPRNSLATLAQTGAPADATSQFFSLRAPASVQRGGELHQCLPASCIFQMHIPYEIVFSHEGADSHHDGKPLCADGANPHENELLSLMPGEVLCRALPYTNVSPHGGADPHPLKLFL